VASWQARRSSVCTEIEALTRKKESLEKFIALAEKGLEEAKKENQPDL